MGKDLRILDRKWDLLIGTQASALLQHQWPWVWKSLNKPEALAAEGTCRGVGICGTLGTENRAEMSNNPTHLGPRACSLTARGSLRIWYCHTVGITELCPLFVYEWATKCLLKGWDYGQKWQRIIFASSSVLRPLLGKEPTRGGEEVRLPIQGCRNSKKEPESPLVNLTSSCLALLLRKLPKV